MAGKRTGASRIRDVASLAGVSVATASRVLSSSTYPVGADTRAKVEAAARTLGYVPNALARSLSRARTDVIGVVAPFLRNPYYAAMVEAIDAAAKQLGLLIQVGLTDGDEEMRERIIDRMLAQQVDGIIVCAGADDHLAGRHPDQSAAPMVLIGAQPNAGYPMVTTDNVLAGQSAGAHLWSLGHRQFVYLTAFDSWHEFKAREEGLRSFLTAQAEPSDFVVIDGLQDEHDAYAAVSRLVPSRRSTAIVASTDRHALGALAALSDHGLSVPGEVSVMGFDDYVTSGFLRPALTTLRMPAGEMGEAAMKLLAMAMAGEPLPNVPHFEATLIVRQSTGPAPT